MMNAIEQFLYREARLMDEGRYAEWHALWTGEGVYWVPSNDDDADPKTHVAIIYDDKGRLAERIERLKSGTVLAQEPTPRMRRLISNIEILSEGDIVEVASNFMLAVIRFGAYQIWVGRTVHHLKPDGDSFLINDKKVMLINNDEPIPVLQFLL